MNIQNILGKEESYAGSLAEAAGRPSAEDSQALKRALCGGGWGWCCLSPHWEREACLCLCSGSQTFCGPKGGRV